MQRKAPVAAPSAAPVSAPSKTGTRSLNLNAVYRPTNGVARPGQAAGPYPMFRRWKTLHAVGVFPCLPPHCDVLAGNRRAYVGRRHLWHCLPQRAFTEPQRTLVSGFGRMLVLNRPGGRKAKVASAKVTAPRPFNLPSLKSENSGLDPATQIVPSGGGGWGGGQRPEDDEGMHPGLATPFLGYANG